MRNPARSPGSVWHSYPALSTLEAADPWQVCHARSAWTIADAEQHEIQEKIQKLERQQRRQRQEIFKAEDEIIEKRDQLIDSLERRLAQRTETETLFTIRWAVE